MEISRDTEDSPFCLGAAQGKLSGYSEPRDFSQDVLKVTVITPDVFVWICWPKVRLPKLLFLLPEAPFQ